MDFELKDVFHYYLGQRFRFTWPNGDVVEDILSWTNNWGTVTGTNMLNDLKEDFEIDNIWKEGKMELMLHHMRNMPQELREEYQYYCLGSGYLARSAFSTQFLIKEGYDVFGLIESGDAIDIAITNSVETIGKVEIGDVVMYHNISRRWDGKTSTVTGIKRDRRYGWVTGIQTEGRKGYCQPKYVTVIKPTAQCLPSPSPTTE